MDEPRGVGHGGRSHDAPRLQDHLPYGFAAPVLTRRLALRIIEADDADDVFAYQSREDVCRYNVAFEPRSRAEVVESIARHSANRQLAEDSDFVKLVVERRDCPGRVIGEVLLELRKAEHAEGEIGWMLHPDHAGQGYMTEAMVALVDLAFSEIGVHRLTARMDARNERSLAMASRLGMRPEGRLVQAEWSRGAWHDVVLYALLSHDWPTAAMTTR